MFRASAYSLIGLVVFLMLSCSGGGSNPVAPPSGQGGEIPPALTGASAPPEVTDESQSQLWGLWDIYLNTETMEVEVVPNRGAQFTANVVQFVDGPPSNLVINIEDIIYGPDHIDIMVDVGLRHPFAGLDQYTGFDVCGVFMGNGSGVLDADSQFTTPSDLDQQLLNPDGFTRWFNANEFSNPANPVLGYTPGKSGTPGYVPTSELNPYKYFADGLGSKDDAYEFLMGNAERRGSFTPGNTNFRFYEIRFPTETDVNFQYAVIAHWKEPENPPYSLDQFAPEANADEALVIDVQDESILYYVDTNVNGGVVKLDITPWDWSAAAVSGVMEEYQINCYSTGWDGPFAVDMTAVEMGPNYNTFTAEIPVESLDSGDPVPVWVEVLYPGLDYTNEFGVQNGADGILASYFFMEIPVASELPNPITVISPNGGEDLLVGGSYEVEWLSTISGGTVTIQYSKDNFVSDVNEIISGGPNTGSYMWDAIPDDPTSSARVRVIYDPEPGLYDDSDEVFNIVYPEVEVTIPNGGEEFGIGTDRDIEWSTNIPNGTVTIEYSKDDFGSDVNTIVAGVANSGSYTWTNIPDDPTSTAKVRITHDTFTSATDVSDDYFAIVELIITVTQPNGGEQWLVGDSKNITWTSGFSLGTVAIEYSKDNFVSDINTIATSEPLDGSYTWNPIPDDPSNTVKVRISWEQDTSISDMSDANFSIVTPTVTVTSPNGGEQFLVGESENITWTSNIPGGNVTIRYSKDNFVSDVNTIIAGTANDGSYTWNPIPNDPSTTVKVRITHDTFTSATDESDNNFSIVIGNITVASPNGSEEWIVGSSHDVTWTSNISGGTVKIEYSKDNFGSDVNTIVTGTANDGSYTWNPIPDDPSTTARVKITYEPQTSINDISDADFTIAKPTITVTSPNGGELWYAGDNEDITWTSQYVSGNVLIEYSKDNFVSDINTIQASAFNDGSYTWNVPEDPSDTVRVRISSVLDSTVNDTSDDDFTICSGLAPLDVTGFTASDGNGSLNNREVQLSWTSSGCVDFYDIERYNYAWGADYAPGSWAWEALTTVSGSTSSYLDTDAYYASATHPVQYRIKARNSNGSSAWATDNGYPKLRNVYITFWCWAEDDSGTNPFTTWTRAMNDLTWCNSLWNKYGLNFVLENPNGQFRWFSNPAWYNLSGDERFDMHAALGEITSPQSVNVYYTATWNGGSKGAWCQSFCDSSYSTTEHIIICIYGTGWSPAYQMVLAHENGHGVARLFDQYNVDPNRNLIIESGETCAAAKSSHWSVGCEWELLCDDAACYPQNPNAGSKTPRNLMWYGWLDSINNYNLVDSQWQYFDAWVSNNESNYPYP